MSKTIHKQILNIGASTISVPYFSKILKVDTVAKSLNALDNQRGHLCVWYICEQKWLQDDGREKWMFKTAMTGEDFDLGNTWSYIDTVQFANGDFILHVFMKV